MAITYVNDLRLSEMATGDNSGTWGNVTNTNLELIGDAFGHGTRAIANASTDNITIADGTADADRAMYLKLTGGGQACEITLLPNTVSKVWMMENGTAAALTFTQGSGASVIIPAGDTKIIASDGGGSGAIVYDVFASLSVVDLKVQDDLTVTDDVSIGGILGVTGVLTTTAATVFNGGFASNAGSTITTADNLPQLTLISTDADAGKGPVLDLFRNSANPAVNDVMGQIKFIGEDDGGNQVSYARINTEIESPADGNEIGRFNIITLDNLAGSAGEHERLTISGTESVFNEDHADIDFRVESDTHTHAFFVDGETGGVLIGDTAAGLGAGTPDAGRLTLQSLGNSSQLNMYRADSSIAGGDTLGLITAYSNDTDGNSIEPLVQIQFAADGAFSANDNPTKMVFLTTPDSSETMREVAKFDNVGSFIMAATSGTIQTATAGTSNFRAGVNAGDSIASGGNFNVVVGDDAGTAITTGDNNTALGYQALKTENANSNNTAIGHQALKDQDGGDGNTAVGSFAIHDLTNASRATAVGSYAGFSNLGADDVTFIGHNTGLFATTAAYSVFVGSKAGQGITGTKLTGNHNVAIGFSAGLLLQGTATENVLVGSYAGDAITTGSENVCMGLGAGGSINTGTRNVCLGDDAGNQITTATRSIAIGHIAMGQTAVTGEANIAIGNQAGNSMLAGANNIMIGEESGKTINSGARNTCVGPSSATALTTAVDNVFIGSSAGTYTVGTTTGSYNTIIGGYCHTSAVNSIQQIVMGHNVTGNGNNTLCFGNATTDSSIAFGATSITAPSDQRYKEEIADATAGLSFIKDLRPVTFKWKKEKDVPSDHPAYKEGSDKRVMESNGEINHGFIAQEVKAVIDNHSEIKDGFAMWSEQGLDENGNSTGGRQRLGEGALIPILVKAIQELEARLAVLEG